jgi:NAD(P)-dependent dehydrogenase (short-subunit alcohol dehydrogenase family)
MNILVFGHNSFVAKQFVPYARSLGHVVVTASTRSAGADYFVDMTDESAVASFELRAGLDFEAVFFCQGMNPSVGLGDIGFGHFARMYQINVAGPAVLVRRLLKRVAPGGSFLFLGSAAARRGSYDPAYGSCKAALVGLVNSLARYNPTHRFNLISLALVEGSPVSQGMPDERRGQHAATMFGGQLVDPEGVARLALEIFANRNINRADYPLDGGMLT